MSKSKASRRARDAKHVRLYLYMLKAPAWLSLTYLGQLIDLAGSEVSRCQ
jgi:hypothetical protein